MKGEGTAKENARFAPDKILLSGVSIGGEYALQILNRLCVKKRLPPQAREPLSLSRFFRAFATVVITAMLSSERSDTSSVRRGSTSRR